jgi:hypothetical protein
MLPVQAFAHQVEPAKAFAQADVVDVAFGIQPDRKGSLIGRAASSAAVVQSGNPATKDVVARIRRASDFRYIA